MERMHSYYGTRAELLLEIEEAKLVVNSSEPLHEDPVEDLTIRGIWGALLESLMLQLQDIDHVSDVA